MMMVYVAAPVRVPTRTTAEWLAEVRRCEREAELFLAYDLARQGLEEYPQDLALKHRAVLCLASTGARERAAEEFRRLGLDQIVQDLPPDIPPSLGFDLATLEARLLKDKAIATTGAERIEKLMRAGDAYEAVYRRMEAAGNPEAYYPGINCATLRLLAGDNDGAQGFALKMLDQLASLPAQKKSYYEIATELEAKLILSDFAEATADARIIAAQVKDGSEHDFRALASTIRQLRLVAAAKQIDPDTLAELAPPRVIHYLGHIISAGIVTENVFGRVARQDRLPAWIGSPTADIASRRRSSSTRSGFISGSP